MLTLERVLVGGGASWPLATRRRPQLCQPNTSPGICHWGAMAPGLRTMGLGKLLLGKAGPPAMPPPNPAICPFSDQLQALWTATPKSCCLPPRALGRPNQGPAPLLEPLQDTGPRHPVLPELHASPVPAQVGSPLSSSPRPRSKPLSRTHGTGGRAFPHLSRTLGAPPGAILLGPPRGRCPHTLYVGT